MDCSRAAVPTSISPDSKNETMDGNGLRDVCLPSKDGIILISPSENTATAELLVPKSMPKTLVTIQKLRFQVFNL